MCPTLMFDKDKNVKMAVGGSGGTKITTSIAQVWRELLNPLAMAATDDSLLLQVMLKALFFNYDLKTAVSEPRLHNQLSPNTTVVEPGFDKVSLGRRACAFGSPGFLKRRPLPPRASWTAWP